MWHSVSMTVVLAMLGGEPRDDDRADWAYTPVHPVDPPPATVGSSFARNPIDSFVLDRLRRAKLSLSPEADRSTLIRRLSFDLIGLPPTIEEQRAFEDDPDPDAYEKLVERLLNNPQYGVRWAQHWLDLVRYADTDGFEPDRRRPSAWRYRDWVVYALNCDMPYDQFVACQIAGDEAGGGPLPYIATGFLRCPPDMFNTNDQRRRRQNNLNEMTDTVASVFLGITLGCARCHDHKTEPFSQEDYYGFQAYFAGVLPDDNHPIASSAQVQEHELRSREWEARLADLEGEIIHVEYAARESLASGPPPRASDAIKLIHSMTFEERSPGEVRALFAALSQDDRISGENLLAKLGPEVARRDNELRSRLAALRKSPPPALPVARGVREEGPLPPPTHLLRRGDLNQPEAELAPSVPPCLTGEGLSAPPEARPAATSGRRSALAAWVVDPKNPLTARVAVNRIWQHHFGRGIVATPSDFGSTGEAPSHPELLDWLAAQFIKDGWSIKSMHRLIVSSAAYRQSSSPNLAALEVDARNELLWRQRRVRLDAEQIRDAMLACSRTIDLQRGGPGVEYKSEQSPLPGQADVEKEPSRHRRSLYLLSRRGARNSFLEAFDRADGNATCPVRGATTTPNQSLGMLNSRFALDVSRGLGSVTARVSGRDEASQVEFLFRQAIGRAPDAAEAKLLCEFLGEGGGIDEASHVIINSIDFFYIY